MDKTFPSHQLATFAAQLQARDIPPHVLRKTEDLLVDWFGSAVAGKGARAVETIGTFIEKMGPGTGPSEILYNRKRSTPYFAAMANAAASHVVEQDDVHNGSVFHPATVVFSPAVAVAQAMGASGQDLLVASIVGYEVGIRVGEFLGRSHYRIFHTTGTAGSIAAAAAVGHLLNLTPSQMLHAFGSAGTQAAGLWEFLRDAADSKQLHTAHAAGTGLMSAYLAKDGFTGAQQILEGKQGMAAGMSTDADVTKLTDRLGSRWATVETSFKFHASCRHTHPAADALLQVMRDHHLTINDLKKVTTHVHQGAIDVLGPVVDPATVHQSKFSMGTVLSLAAKHGFAGLSEFDQDFKKPEITDLRDRVVMVLDDEVDAAYPNRWIGKVTVETNAGHVFAGRVDEPKGDPGNTLSRDEIEEKAMRIGVYSHGATRDELKQAIDALWHIESAQQLGGASAMTAFKRLKDALSSAQAFLFVPGNRPERFSKALATHAHAVIIDLEDAVPLAQKQDARHMLLEALPDLLKEFSSRIVLRINAYGTPFFHEDLELVKKLGINAVLLPKAESKAQLAEIESKLQRPVWIIPMIESAQGIDQMKDIASHPSVVRLTLGNIDLQANLGMACGADELELLPLRYQMTVMSRLFELAAPIDGVTVNLTSDQIIQGDIARGKRLGFTAKLCIHPAQVDPVIAGFRPSDADIEKAKAIVLADANAAGGAVQLDGKMVDRPVVLMAKLVLQQAGIQ